MARRPYSDLATAVIGTLLIGSGVYGLMSPEDMAKVFGVVDVNRDIAVFYPAASGRTLAAGLAVWWLTLAGQRKALGIFLICWVLAGAADTYLLLSHYDEVDSVWVHVLGTVNLAYWGTKLLHSY